MLVMQRLNPKLCVLRLILFVCLLLAAWPVSAQTDEPTASQTKEMVETPLENCLLDLVIALDESPSIGPSFDDADDEFSFVIGFATGLIEGLPVDEDNVNVGVVLYDQTPDTLLPITSEHELAIETLETYNRDETSGTALAQGIDLAVTELSAGRPAVQDVIVILADGDDNQIGEPVDSAEAAREANIQLFSVAVGNVLNADQLAAVANDRDEDYFFQAEDFSELAGLIDSINRNACGVPSTLSGVVFSDADEDAEFDGSESGVEGVTVRLYAADDLTTPAVPDQITDANGAYTFQVAPGEYVVEIADPPQPLVEGSLFDVNTGQTEPITVEINDTIEDINAPLLPLPEPTSTFTQTPTAAVTRTPVPTTSMPTTAPPTGPRAIQFNHQDNVSGAAGVSNQLTVQFGNIGSALLTNIVVVCRVSEGEARFSGDANTNSVFNDVEAAQAELIFSGLAELPAGQNYSFNFGFDPVAGVSQITCELVADDTLVGSDTQQVSVR
jgi:hypothetical protein